VHSCAGSANLWTSAADMNAVPLCFIIVVDSTIKLNSSHVCLLVFASNAHDDLCGKSNNPDDEKVDVKELNLECV